MSQSTYLYSPQWSPDGSKIEYTANGYKEENYGQLYIMNADGSNSTRVIDDGPITQTPSNNPDW